MYNSCSFDYHKSFSNIRLPMIEFMSVNQFPDGLKE